ncbi:MAG TPA: prolipoprotein diacylglyceryl transferase family protein [Terracidiphilus sp.]|jgi:phosphatidylglycerol:prolipoprotein diacylglycerol transferase
MTLAPFVLPLPVAPPYFTILTPGFVWSAALLAAVGYAARSARLSGLSARAMYWAAISSLVSGLWGAHLLSLLVHGWQGGPWALFQFMQGGKSLFGGLVVGGLVGAFYFRKRKLSLLAYADAAMPALALGYAIGRIGCFLNGDDYGALTSARFAIVYPPGTEAYEAHLTRGWISAGSAWSLPVHPVQIYASLLGILLFLALAWGRPKRIGTRFCTYLAVYGAGRFLLEYLRGDFQKALGPFSLPQLFCIGFAFLSACLWLRLHQRRDETDSIVIPLPPVAVLTQQ